MVIDRDLGYSDFVDEVIELSQKEVAVGIFDEKNAQKAIYNEFGTREIPQRSFLRTTMAENEDFAVKIYADVAKLSDFERAGEAMADFLSLKVVEKIKNGNFPPNAPSTIKRKGFNKPLIDKGEMIKSIKGKVRDRK